MYLIKKTLDGLTNIYFFVGTISFVLLLVLNIVEIVARYFFKYSNLWNQEVSLLLVSWAIFLSFGKVVVEKEDIAIVYLIDKFPSKYYKLVQILNSLLLFLTAGYMLLKTIQLIEQQIGQTTLIANIPNMYYTLPLALVLFLVCIHSVVSLLEITINPTMYNAKDIDYGSHSYKGVD